VSSENHQNSRQRLVNGLVKGEDGIGIGLLRPDQRLSSIFRNVRLAIIQIPLLSVVIALYALQSHVSRHHVLKSVLKTQRHKVHFVSSLQDSVVVEPIAYRWLKPPAILCIPSGDDRLPLSIISGMRYAWIKKPIDQL